MRALPFAGGRFSCQMALVLALGCAGVACAEDRAANPPGETPAGPVSRTGDTPSEAPFGLSRWGVGASWYGYAESAMQITGPALGLRADRPFQAADRPWMLEGEVSVGRANYSSPVSGDINGLPRIGSAFFVHPGNRPSAAWIPRPEFGLTTEWTDLRGRSTAGKEGYERFNLSLWLGGSWAIADEQQANVLQLRAALMVAGWQRSMLAQAGAQYQNVTNTQRRGLMLSLEQPWQWGETRASIRVQLRAVARSNLVSAGANTVYEPANRSAELSVTFWQ